MGLTSKFFICTILLLLHRHSYCAANEPYMYQINPENVPIGLHWFITKIELFYILDIYFKTSVYYLFLELKEKSMNIKTV